MKEKIHDEVTENLNSDPTFQSTITMPVQACFAWSCLPTIAELVILVVKILFLFSWGW